MDYVFSPHKIDFKFNKKFYPLYLCEYDERSIICGSCPEYKWCTTIDGWVKEEEEKIARGVIIYE
jgi:hypothetical protein